MKRSTFFFIIGLGCAGMAFLFPKYAISFFVLAGVYMGRFYEITSR